MDTDTLSDLAARHTPALVLFAGRRCDCGEDVVQTAFLRLTQQPLAPGDALAWLYRVVRNAAGDAVRSSRRRQRHEALAATARPQFVESDGDTGPDAGTATDALSVLPTEVREVIVAHIWGGCTFEQIARSVGSSAATCYRRYAAGLALLRERLGVPDLPDRPRLRTVGGPQER